VVSLQKFAEGLRFDCGQYGLRSSRYTCGFMRLEPPKWDSGIRLVYQVTWIQDTMSSIFGDFKKTESPCTVSRPNFRP